MLGQHDLFRCLATGSGLTPGFPKFSREIVGNAIDGWKWFYGQQSFVAGKKVPALVSRR
jgi:hypothetical protein